MLGARGMLASDLRALAPASIDLTAFSRSEVDISDRAAVARAIERHRPDWIINASAFSQVDRAEAEAAEADCVNGTAVGMLGQIARSEGARVLHFGSDYVFDGTGSRPYREGDAVNPLNAYGRSKLRGEVELIASGASALIIRTQWLFGDRGRSFPRTMWERALARAATRVVSDQFGRPTYTHDLAGASWRMLLAGATGVYHVANAGEASWFEVAARVFRFAGADDVLAPCSSAEYPTPARRPAYSVLDTTRAAHDHGIVLPPWDDALTRFLEVLSSRTAARG